MQRFLSVFLCLASLFCLASCVGDKSAELIRSHLDLPMEFDCDFTLGNAQGSAHVRLTEDSVNLGITDGELTGLVVTGSAEHVRFLYRGMDVSFSEKSATSFSRLLHAFRFLREQDFSAKHAVIGDTAKQFSFPYQNATLTYTVRNADGAPISLISNEPNNPINLQFKNPRESYEQS